MLNILGELNLRDLGISDEFTFKVLHGYVQSAATVAHNTRELRDALEGIAALHYVDGPVMAGAAPSSSRPWWFWGERLEFDTSRGDARWNDVIKWWSAELSTRQYDGIIGLSQGSAMASLLLSMASIDAVYIVCLVNEKQL